MSELRGPTGVRADVSAFYRTHLPIHAEACRVAWGLDELEVPVSDVDDPKRDAYVPRAVLSLDRWPLLSVTNGRRTQLRGRGAADHTADGSIVVSATYPMRIYGWVRDEHHDNTLDTRDNLASAVEVTTLAHLTLGVAHMRVDPTTLVTDYSSIDKVKGDRFVAGFYVGFDLRVEEALTDRLVMPGEQPRDTVSAVKADATLLRPPLNHPGLQ